MRAKPVKTEIDVEPVTGGELPVAGGCEPVAGGCDPVAGGGVLPVAGGWVPVAGGCVPVIGGCVLPVAGGLEPVTTVPGTRLAPKPDAASHVTVMLPLSASDRVRAACTTLDIRS